MARFGRNSFKPDLAVPNHIAQAIVDRVLPGRTLLDGYGEPAREDWRTTVELYYLYYILEFWCWCALLGNDEPLPRLVAQMEGYTAT
jgi:hypothetical protein